MTREEHIYQLTQYLQGRLISMCPSSSLYWKEHWEEVIKALEQEPTTKNDLGVDCISRVDVLNNLASIAKVKAKSDAQKSLMGRCMFMVERMPPVTPQEPRKGRWIDEGIYADGQSYHAFMCSACEWHFIENKSELENYKYCPFCGADMREVKNDKRRDTNTDHSTT